MLKKERLVKIIDMINKSGIITVNDIMQTLDVSDMTVRRDLDELENSGKLIRVHGGAQSLTYKMNYELSHAQKKEVNVGVKLEIAQVAASLVNEGDTIFLGPGTTIELMAECINTKNIRIITNSYPVFEKLQNNTSIQVILIGGVYRNQTGSFIGTIANSVLQNLKFTKAFIGSNGIHNNAVSTYSVEEGEVQRIALNNANKKFLLADFDKLNKDDFYVFYSLYDIDTLITDITVNPEIITHYSQYTHVLTKDNI